MIPDSQTPVSILMAAIGGYGYYYMKALMEDFNPGEIEIAGVVDPMAELSGRMGLNQTLPMT